MIDIKKAEEEFKSYSTNYDMNESHIERKVRHTFRVVGICEKIASSIGINEEKIKLAKLIGLLHDIARFEQYTRYKTYDDLNSIDHANLAVEILRKDDYIRKYIETDQYDEIILKSIEYHNKYAIGNDVNEEEGLFCKIIRDADKLDIMYQATCETWKERINYIEDQEISPKVFEQFIEKQLIDRYNVKNDIDRVVVDIAFIYDYNFKENYKIIKENNYIDKTIERFNFKKDKTKKQMDLIRKIANDYIEEQINNN